MSVIAPYVVMAGLVPAIHALSFGGRPLVDARDKPGHDGDGRGRAGGLSADIALALRRADKVRQASDLGAKGVDPAVARDVIDAMAPFMSRARNLIKTDEEDS